MVSLSISFFISLLQQLITRVLLFLSIFCFFFYLPAAAARCLMVARQGRRGGD
jgi:hypothetical protein